MTFIRERIQSAFWDTLNLGAFFRRKSLQRELCLVLRHGVHDTPPPPSPHCLCSAQFLTGTLLPTRTRL
jgi:hypothetical protein